MTKTRNFKDSTWLHILLWLVLISVVMLPRLLNLDIFIGPDELAIWGWGNRFAQVLAQGDWNNILIGDGYPAVTVMWIHTIGITLKWLWLQVTGTGTSFEQVIELVSRIKVLPYI